ncbi:MAG: hypothetical protein ACYSU3_12115 [Planctomycetota bacterium]
MKVKKIVNNQIKKMDDRRPGLACNFFSSVERNDNMKRIFIFSFVLSLFFSLGTFAGGQPTESTKDKRGKVWIFRDGAGNPLSFATGVVYVRRVGSNERRRCASFVLDDQGTYRRLYWSDKNASYYIILEHPDYGVHSLPVPSNPGGHEFRIPMVLPGTEAYKRSIRGYILDDANNPINGVLLRTKYVHPPGGKTIYVTGTVRTNELGWFHLYPLVHPSSKPDIGELIPSNTCYSTRIEPPSELGLAPTMMCLSNNSDLVIRMKEPGYFHTIRFKDADGWITDKNRLIRFHLDVSKLGMNDIRFEYGEYEKGRNFPLGTYTIDNWLRDCEFEHIDVTKESPEELVFKTKNDFYSVTYSGRVVHGVTGRPMPGAFVVAASGVDIVNTKNFSHFTREQWDRLHTLPESFSVNGKILEQMSRPISFKNHVPILPDVNDYPKIEAALFPVGDMYGLKKGVRTDINGRFEIKFDRKEKFYSFVVFEEGYLGIEELKQFLKPGLKGRVQVPTIPLFPAAKVIVEPNVAKGRGSMVPQWIIDFNDCPEWVNRTYVPVLREDSLSSDESIYTELIKLEEDPNRIRTISELGGAFTYCRRVERNKPQTIHVPAGVRLKVQVRPLQDLKNVWVPFTYPQTVSLEQGETLDLGKCEIKRSMMVVVKVVDSAGNPVEGVPVENPIEEWLGPKSTDSSGIVRFYVYPHSEGEFSIKCRKHNLWEYVSYEVGGKEDSGREFLLLISDELISHFVK